MSILDIYFIESEFLRLSFVNKGLHAINLGNILHHRSVKSKIPPYLKGQYVPIISYTYTYCNQNI
jgi:hypothetical protein